jgi:cytoskeletal protein CcmA (bactofilin family)
METTTITLQELDEKGACFDGCELFERYYPKGNADYWDVIKKCIALEEFWDINWILKNLDFTLPDLVLDELPDEPVFVYPGKVIIKGDVKITGKVLTKGGLNVIGKLIVCGYARIWGNTKADEINVNDGCIYGRAYGETINVSNKGWIYDGAYGETINVSGDGHIYDGAYGETINVSGDGHIYDGAYGETINVSNKGRIYGGANGETINVSDKGRIYHGAYGQAINVSDDGYIDG